MHHTYSPKTTDLIHRLLTDFQGTISDQHIQAIQRHLTENSDQLDQALKDAKAEFNQVAGSNPAHALRYVRALTAIQEDQRTWRKPRQSNPASLANLDKGNLTPGGKSTGRVSVRVSASLEPEQDALLQEHLSFTAGDNAKKRAKEVGDLLMLGLLSRYSDNNS